MKTPRSILILNWRCPKNPLSGGAEIVTLKHAEYWIHKGHKVVWLAGNYSGGKQFEIMKGVEIYRYGSPFTIHFLVPFIYWLKFKGNFDIIIDEIHGIPFFSTIWTSKSPKLVFIHEIAKEIWDEMIVFPFNHIGKIIERFFYKFYRYIDVLTASNSTKNDLIEYYVPEKRIHVIPHGVSLKPITKPSTKNKYLTLVVVSRLVRMKAVEDSIYIFEEVSKKLPSSRMIIIGSGKVEYIEQLKKLVRTLRLDKYVQFTGYISEAKKILYLRSSHFLLHTSLREGFGLVIHEANSQGTPAVVYDAPGLKDVLKQNINGLNFAKSQKNELVNEIIHLYLNKQLYEKLAVTSIEYSKNFLWEPILIKTFKLVRSIMGD